MLDVAGGRGAVSFELHSKNGIHCTLVDPREPKLDKFQHKHMRAHPSTELAPHIASLFDSSFVEAHAPLVDHVSCVVGMHPDEATEVIVDFALSRNLPFAVVPCCVFASVFPHRRLLDGSPVFEYDTFVQYLREKDARIQSHFLNLHGRNQVVFLNPDPVAVSSTPQ